MRFPGRPPAVGLLKQMEIKKTLWFLINIYGSDPPSRETALLTVMAYRQIKRKAGVAGPTARLEQALFFA